MTRSRRRSATKRKSPAKRNQSNIPGWVWLLTGVVLGAFVMFLFYLKDVPPLPAVKESSIQESGSQESALSSAQSTTEASTKNSTDRSASGNQPPKETTSDGAPAPDFVFYQLLKENELVVETDPTVSEQAALKALNSVEYIIQAGSFRNYDDAERLRAKLILNDLPTKIDSKTVGESTWHRIMVGPFRNRPMTAKARGTLASMNIDTMVIKRNIEP